MVGISTKRAAILLFGIMTIAFCPGCAMFQAQGDHSFFRGRLADGRQVELCEDWRMDALRNNAQHNYSALLVQVSADDQRVIQHEIARQTGTATKVPDFWFEKVEARSDASGQRVWFIDESNKQVIASMDLQNGKTTGPRDRPPPWASPNGGQRVVPSPACRQGAS
jgi:hypothetical protein